MPTTHSVLCVPNTFLLWLIDPAGLRGGGGRDGTGGHRTGVLGRLKLLYVEVKGSPAYQGSACSGNRCPRRCCDKGNALSPRELLGGHSLPTDPAGSDISQGKMAASRFTLSEPQFPHLQNSPDDLKGSFQLCSAPSLTANKLRLHT